MSKRRPSGGHLAAGARNDSRTGGFTLLEALLALVLVGAALLLDLGLEAHARAIDAQVAAEADLLRRAQAAIESVRAGVHPLRTGQVDGQVAWPVDADPGLAMVLVVEPTEVAGLCRLEVRGQLPTRGRMHDVALDTLVWQPGSPCR